MPSRNRNELILTFMIAATLPGTSFAANFAEDIAFLKQHTDVIVLTNKENGAKLAVAPAWQGRVMTSSAEGDSGLSFGWINRELIASGKVQPHINARGGEDRFWLGPEGGQFSIFFAKDAPFDLEHWFTPAPLDTLRYGLLTHSADKAKFGATFSLTNYSGARFEVMVVREVRLLSNPWGKVGLRSNSPLKLVVYETYNEIINAGPEAWKKETGLLSIWILGMFNPSRSTTIVVPVWNGSEAELGPKVTSAYFGQVPADRLVVKDDVIYFSGDGRFRRKIGINPTRCKGILGSYDADNHALTIVQFVIPKNATDYVNSLWKIQDKPYAGDAANSYNDGPPSPGAKPLGPFYELESSSPAAELKPGKSLIHIHRTMHLIGAEPDLDPVARTLLSVSLADIKSALPR